MKEETKKAPTIRFRRFTKDWEQHKLGALTDLYVGKSFTGQLNSNAKYIVMDMGTVSPDGFRIENKRTNTLRDVLKADDLIMPKDDIGRGLIIAKTAYIPTNNQYVLGDHVYRLRFDNNSGLFMHFLINTPWMNRSFKRKVTGSAQLGIKALNVLNQDVTIPDIKEQKMIGQYFLNLDNLIILHQRKLDQLKKLKKYFLQNMFPAKGEKVPRIRFKGFTGDWEQKKLIDVCDYVDYRGKTPSKTTSGIFLVTAKNIKDGYIDYEASQEYISENDYDEVMHRGKPKIGDVLITTEAPCGNVAQVNKENIALAQRIIKYRGHSHVMDNAYLKYYLLSPEFQGILYAKSSGGTVQGIKGSILHKQKISFPKYEEQVKIGQYLDDLDNLITLHQHKLDQLQTMKKFMLQNLFI